MMKTMFLDIKDNVCSSPDLLTKTQRQWQRWQQDLLVVCIGQRHFIWISNHPSRCSQIQIGTTSRKIDKFQNYENDVFGHKTQLRHLQRWQLDLLVACMGQRPFIWISNHPSRCSQIQIGTTYRKIDKFQNYENDVFGHKRQRLVSN